MVEPTRLCDRCGILRHGAGPVPDRNLAGSSPAPPIQTPVSMRKRFETVGQWREEPRILRIRAAPGAALSNRPNGRDLTDSDA